MSSQENISQLLCEWNDGDPSALNRLVPLVEHELRRMAHHHMCREDAEHTLQTSALINEFYLKLTDQDHPHWHNRIHFFAIAAQIMRRILVDHARRRLRNKRGGGEYKIPLDEVTTVLSPQKSADLLALDEALDRLAKLDPMKSKIVELRHFSGLSVEETAEVLQVSKITVMRHWDLAKSWLRREVRGEKIARQRDS